MKIHYLLLLLLLFTCCQSNKKATISDLKDVVTIEMKEYPSVTNKMLDPNKYFDSVKYVFLEETTESIVPSMSEVFFTDSMIIIPSGGAGTIFFFDQNGNYLHKINKKGRGPGEYLSIRKVMVDEDREQVMVYDIDTRRMLFYDYKGNHLKTIKKFSGGTVISDLINMPDGSFLCYHARFAGDNKQFPAGLWRVDENGKFDDFLYEITEVYPSNSSYHLFYLSYLNDGIIGFMDFNTNNTYHIINDELLCRSRYKIPKKTMADCAGIETSEDLALITNYQEKGDYIFTHWKIAEGQLGAMTALTKSDNSVEIGIVFSPVMKEDIMISPLFIRNNRPNICTAAVEQEEIKMYLQYPPVAEKLKKILEIAPETTNPVLQINYVKSKKTK